MNYTDIDFLSLCDLTRIIFLTKRFALPLNTSRIKDDGRLPCFISKFVIYSRNFRKSNTDKKHIKFGECSCNRMKVMGNLKIQDVSLPPR